METRRAAKQRVDLASLFSPDAPVDLHALLDDTYDGSSGQGLQQLFTPETDALEDQGKHFVTVATPPLRKYEWKPKTAAAQPHAHTQRFQVTDEMEEVGNVCAKLQNVCAKH